MATVQCTLRPARRRWPRGTAVCPGPEVPPCRCRVGLAIRIPVGQPVGWPAERHSAAASRARVANCPSC